VLAVRRVAANAVLRGLGHSHVVSGVGLVLARLLALATEGFTLGKRYVPLAFGASLRHIFPLNCRYVLLVPLVVAHILVRAGNLFLSLLFRFRRLFFRALRSAVDILGYCGGALRIVTSAQKHDCT